MTPSGTTAAISCSRPSPSACAAVIRVDDVVARLGGDEFVVIQTRVDGKDSGGRFCATPHLRCDRANEVQGASRSLPR